MKIQYKDKIIEIEEPITIQELLKEEIENSQYTVVAAEFNNEYKSLNYKIEQDGKLELIDVTTKEGIRVYTKTLSFIVAKAFEKLCPNKKINVNYQLSNSMFYDIENEKATEEFVETLEKEIRAIVEKDLPITEVIMNREEAKKFYEEHDNSRGRLQYDFEENKEIHLYYCEDYYNYFYGIIANRTGCVNIFKAEKYNDGFIIKYPSPREPGKMPETIHNKKLAWALEEYNDIHRVLNMHKVYRLNRAIQVKRIREIITLAEALHEKKIANIADEIAKNKKVKMVLVAGPSSSGKTTFAQRLQVQLRLNGIKPVTISVDNYFVEREETPRDENGEYDFECIEAIDLKLFNEHLTRLLNGEEVEMPEFDFLVGTKRYNGKKLKLAEDEMLLIEGIHCLNDKLTSEINKEQKYKIYISDLTILNLDRYNRISTTDTRLIRRIVRDYQFRGYSALHTLHKWDSVNRGEFKNIFPFQEQADSIFNTSLVYELNALKPIVMPLLQEITNQEPEYAEARRLINILRYFEPIPADYVPNNSLLKEFLGGSIFEY